MDSSPTNGQNGSPTQTDHYDVKKCKDYDAKRFRCQEFFFSFSWIRSFKTKICQIANIVEKKTCGLLYDRKVQIEEQFLFGHRRYGKLANFVSSQKSYPRIRNERHNTINVHPTFIIALIVTLFVARSVPDERLLWRLECYSKEICPKSFKKHQ